MVTFGDPIQRDDVSPFVQPLWERGVYHEKEIIRNLKLPFLDLSGYFCSENVQRTTEAMDQGIVLVYSGRICNGDMIGEPHLLRRTGKRYIAGDIKSGAWEDGGAGDESRKPKKHHAVQLWLYTNVIEKQRKSGGRVAFVWDIHGQEVEYDFEVEIGKRDPHTLWQDYEESLIGTHALLGGATIALPAYAGTCKNCVWHTACLKHLKETDDLTLIPELGAAEHDVMIGTVRTVREFAAADPNDLVSSKMTLFPGIGLDSLVKFRERARLLSADNATPYLRECIVRPNTNREIFFDIEVDPMREVCYLHGIVERLNGDNASEKFVAFFANKPTPDAEESTFTDAWHYLISASDAAVFYYLKYERTIYKVLARNIPRYAVNRTLKPYLLKHGLSICTLT